MAHMHWFTCQFAISRHSAPKAKGLWEEREQTTHRSSHCCHGWAVSLAGLTPPGHLSWGGLGACSLSPFPALRRVWHWLECHSPTASHTPGNAHGITSWAAHQRGALQAIKSEPNPRWPQPQLAALGAAAPSEGGRSCLLYIVTAGAKLLHPSHLLAAVQLINWSQEFLSGLEQHPEASDHSYCQSCKHCSDASNISFLLPSQPPVSGFFGCKLMFRSWQPSLWKLDRLLFFLPAFCIWTIPQDNKTRTKICPECWLLHLNSKSWSRL